MSPGHATAPLYFWPYEERFELLTEGDLLRCPDTLWKECSARAGATIVAADVTPSYRSYVLSLSSLIVFPQRLVLMTCSESGVAYAAEYLLRETAALLPTYAACERRAPPRSSPYTPYRRTSTTNLLSGHILQHQGAFWNAMLNCKNSVPSTEVTLFHTLRERISLVFVQEIVSRHLPHHSLLSHQFPANGISLNALDSDSYLSLHYTEDTYLSLEGSFVAAHQRQAFKRIVVEIERAVAPEAVTGTLVRSCI